MTSYSLLQKYSYLPRKEKLLLIDAKLTDEQAEEADELLRCNWDVYQVVQSLKQRDNCYNTARHTYDDEDYIFDDDDDYDYDSMFDEED